MATPITWKNIAAPDFSTSVAALNSARSSFDSAGDSVLKVLADKKKLDEANWDNTAKNNTADIIAMRNKITGLADYRGSEDQFNLGALKGQYGVQYDQDKVDAAGTTLLGKLRDKATSAAALEANSVAGSTNSKAKTADAFYQNLLAQKMDPREAARRTTEYANSDLMLKDMAWNEQTAQNTQAFINSLAGRDIDFDNPQALEAEATKQFGNLVDMGVIRGLVDRKATAAERQSTKEFQQQMALDSAAMRKLTMEQNAANTFFNQQMKLEAVDAAAAAEQRRIQKENDEKGLEEAQAAEAHRNRGAFGWFRFDKAPSKIAEEGREISDTRQAKNQLRLSGNTTSQTPQEIITNAKNEAGIEDPQQTPVTKPTVTPKPKTEQLSGEQLRQVVMAQANNAPVDNSDMEQNVKRQKVLKGEKNARQAIIDKIMAKVPSPKDFSVDRQERRYRAQIVADLEAVNKDFKAGNMTEEEYLKQYAAIVGE